MDGYTKEIIRQKLAAQTLWQVKRDYFID